MLRLRDGLRMRLEGCLPALDTDWGLGETAAAAEKC